MTVQSLAMCQWQMTISRPIFRLLNSKSSVSWKTWTMNMQIFFPSIINEQPFQDHLPSKTVPTWRALSPRWHERWCADSSLVSLTDCHFETIFWVKLSWWLEELCVPWHRNTEHAKAFPVSVMNGHFKGILWVKLYRLKEFCVPGYLNNEYAEYSSV